MLLNFQKQFARPVWSGEKRQTIRAKGKRLQAPKPGDRAYCYTGLRTRSTVKLGDWPISRVDWLRMTVEADRLSNVIVDSVLLFGHERDALARDDGFEDFKAMEAWFVRNHPPGNFSGWVIQWAWAPVPEVALPATP